MTSTERLWMTRQAHAGLQNELAACGHVPASKSRRLHGLRRQPRRQLHARHARIRQIQDLLANAVVGEDPPDDGIAEPGMVLTVRYDDTGEIETFLLGVRGAEDADIDVYSMQ